MLEEVGTLLETAVELLGKNVAKVNAKMVHLWFHDMGVPICFQCPINSLMFGQNKRVMYATKMKNLVKYLH